MSALTDGLKKIPFGLVAVGVVGYFGYEYYQFTYSAESDFNVKKAQIETTKQEIEKAKAKAKDAENFRQSLESRKAQLSEMNKKLTEMKAGMSETVDNAEFMNTVLTEAKKVGLNVISFDRSGSKKQDFYTEHTYNLNFRGVYVQLLVLFERLASVQRVIRVDNFKLKPIAASSSRYVELEGIVEVKTYNYELSAADLLGKTPPPQAPAVPAPKPGGSS